MRARNLKIFILSLIGLLFIVSCKRQSNEENSENILESSNAGIEVIYFYGKQRCSKCVAMEKFAKEAVDSAFSDKIKDGSIIFKSIDITTKEGEKFADLFEVSSSALYIVNNNQERTEKIDMTSFGFRNAKNNRQIYKQGIIDQIKSFLD
ncbi:MAG: thioredoxin [Muribaculaceae bacterium]|nr:thioredoxin [Muribaculaceae bacterium]